jgi:membrane protein
MNTLKRWGILIKDTGLSWQNDQAPRLAAGLAFYSLLSVAPLSLLCVAVVGLVFGAEAAKGQLANQISEVVGLDGAKTIQSIIAHSSNYHSGVLSTIVSLVVLIVGASGVFSELQTSLNQIWKVKLKPDQGVMGFLKNRLYNFTVVLGVAFLLLASLILSAVLSAIGSFFSDHLPGGEMVWHVVNFCLPLLVITVLFSLIYKVIPDVDVRWRDVAVGGFFTAVLFSVGKLLLGLYLGKSTVTSAFGAAGSIVAFVVWVYYVAQILFLGAEFTQVYARSFGRPIAPSAHATIA